MAWLLVFIASAFEVAFALSTKASFGFTNLIPSVIAVTTGIASVVILSQALRTLPVGTGYAAWTGIGGRCRTEIERLESIHCSRLDES